MKRYLFSLIIALLCSFNTWSQTTIPIFTVAHELFRTRATRDSDIIYVLKKHKLATNESWMPTGEKEYMNLRYLENLTNGGPDQMIITNITYDYYNYKTLIVKFSIYGYNYYSTFLKYLEKNNYKLSDRGRITVYKNRDTGYVCSVETHPYDDFLVVRFMRASDDF